MNFDETVRRRRSIRKYRPGEISDGQIEQILDAARLAPSGLNLQPWRFVVAKSREAIQSLAGAIESPFASEASALIVCLTDFQAFSTGDKMLEEFVGKMGDAWVRTNLSMYSAIAVTHILLKATDLGLGSCWLGAFDEAKVLKITSAGDRYGVAAIIAVGYAAEHPEARPRLALDELVLKTL